MARRININKRKNDNLSVGQYDYDGLAHYWVYNYDYKSTAGDRMSISGNIVYSYRTVVAKMFQPRTVTSTPFVLISTSQWGPTTSKQLNCIESSVSHMEYMRVDTPNPSNKADHERNLEIMFNTAMEAIGKYQRARSDWSKNSWLRKFYEMLDNTTIYGEYFKLKNTKWYKRTLTLPDPSGEHSAEQLQEIKDKMEKSERAEKAKRLREVRKKDKKLADQADADLKEWLHGAQKMPNSRYLDKVYLRVNGAVVETTEHASISLKSCIEAYRSHKAGKLKGGDDISGFTFKGIIDGIAHIGCHRVPMSEIERLLKGR